MMQQVLDELARARRRHEEATDLRAKDTLQGVIWALDWVFESGGKLPPSDVAAAVKTDPLDHDGDGKPGGSPKGKLATARKRK